MLFPTARRKRSACRKPGLEKKEAFGNRRRGRPNPYPLHGPALAPAPTKNQPSWGGQEKSPPTRNKNREPENQKPTTVLVARTEKNAPWVEGDTAPAALEPVEGNLTGTRLTSSDHAGALGDRSDRKKVTRRSNHPSFEKDNKEQLHTTALKGYTSAGARPF